jgi:2',3'-cyclic-nucleotide 2'-phosphodiesterase/3'-nucleotidase
LVAAVGAVALCGAAALPAAAAPTNPRANDNHAVDLTVLGTTDVHANTVNWDYLNDRPYAGSSEVGLAKVSTLVNQVRAEKGADRTILIDNGDTLQGATIGYYYAAIDPITGGATHPVAAAMNAMGYDSMTVGNHEFNYGLPTLYEFARQLDAPVLGGNVRDAKTGKPAFAPYVIKTVNLPGHKPIRVGILGLTTPGSAVWDRTHVEGRLTFEGGLETAKQYVPELRKQVDVVIAAMHTGASGGGSSYGDQIPWPENFGTAVAEQVPGIDVVLLGHSHSTIPERFVKNQVSGQDVLVTQPGSWGRALSVIDLKLHKVKGQWTVSDKSSEVLSTRGVAEDPTIVNLVAGAHQKVVDYVNAPIADATQELSLANALLEDTPAIDLINAAQADATARALAGSQYGDLPVLSSTAPFNTSPSLPAGQVTLRQVASLYNYDNNTLTAKLLTGAQLKTFMEWAGEFYNGVSGPGPHRPSDVLRSQAATYFNPVYGVTFDIDLTRPVGDRIVNLAFRGEPVNPEAQFVLATNNYIANGGGNAPVLKDAPTVYDPLTGVRQVLIDWVAERGVIDPSQFASVDWRFTAGDQPLIWAR